MRLLSSNNKIITLLKGVRSLLPDLGEGTKFAQIVNSLTTASIFPQVPESIRHDLAIFFPSFHMLLIPDAAKGTFHKILNHVQCPLSKTNWSIRPTFLQLMYFVWSETKEQQCASERREKEGEDVLS